MKKMPIRIANIVRGRKKSTHDISSLSQTKTFAKKIASTLHGGDVIALQGDLGAGKTTFVQLLARELGILTRVTSPTFVIMNIYPVHGGDTRIRSLRHLCHIDAYRLTTSDELLAIGVGEYIGRSDTVVVIEWAERVRALLPSGALWITFQVMNIC